MKSQVALGCALLAVAACSTTEEELVLLQEGKWVEMSQEEYMAKQMELGMPAEAHAELAKGAGSWGVTGEFWMAPDTPAMTMEGTCQNEMILDGRYMLEKFSSEWMGMAFKGWLIVGYDNMSGQYFNMWIDNMSTRPQVAWGTGDEEGNIDFRSMMHDVMTPGGRPARSEIRHVSNNEFTMTMYDSLPEGGEFKAMHFVYKRK